MLSYDCDYAQFGELLTVYTNDTGFVDITSNKF